MRSHGDAHVRLGPGTDSFAPGKSHLPAVASAAPEVRLGGRWLAS